ncbi:MAG TPA: hypothetical protein VGG02_06690 [Chthoniobacterales bacterium]|jgi:hypothetical protein
MSPPGHQATEKEHEKKDVDVIGVLFVAGLVLSITAICFLTAEGLMKHMRHSHKTAAVVQAVGEGSHFPQPRLEVYPTRDLINSRGASEMELNSYGWVDRKTGTAHIPIARAMELLAARGLPEVGGGQTPLQLMQARPVTNSSPNKPQGANQPEGLQ